MILRTNKTKRYKDDDEEHPGLRTSDLSPRISQKNRTYTCRKCFAQFPKRKLVIEHAKTHTKKEDLNDKIQYKYDEERRIFTCNICPTEFQTEKEAADHFKTNHSEQYTCDECGQVFSSAYKFCCHNVQHSKDNKFCCPLCSYSTVRRTCILSHINRMHYNKFYYYCKTCSKGFNDSVTFKEHDNEHLGLKPFICVVCRKAFVYSRYLQLHQIRAHTVGIEGQLVDNQCPICLRVFAKNSTFLRHSESAHSKNGGPKAKRHLCDVCGKGFASKDKYKIHYRTHTGIKPYACSYCPKSFIKRDYLVMHERVHTGEKPYSCEYCGKCFNQAAPLRIHVRGHTGERPYVCDFCNSGFVSKGSLNMHRKICTGGC